ncbi:SAICAR synthase-like protein [Serendipita vermifera]|nr:SAICAR synthase-like protein [Serendipita vermifera]
MADNIDSVDIRGRPISTLTPAAEHADESSVVTRLRDVIKPLYSQEYRTELTAGCISRSLKRASSSERREVKKADRGSDEWDWNTPLRPKWHVTKLFLIYMVHLARAAPSAFSKLRKEHFEISDEKYFEIISPPLKPLSGLGLSGSTFFHTGGPTSNAGLLIKSINRAFEYEFLHAELLPAYIQYMEEHPGADSLLTRITDVIWSADMTLGALLKISPRHYMVMVDILGDLSEIEGAEKWDLKPTGFFEPTRDLVPDVIKSDATKSGLADTLDPNVRIKLSKSQRDALFRIVERDTLFLERLEIVDYSLLLGRYPASSTPAPPVGLESRGLLPSTITDIVNSSVIREAAGLNQRKKAVTGDDLTRGILSADGQWIYRLSIVDFLWNVNKLVPTVMRTAGKVLPEQTITTQPQRYRKTFLEMLEEYVQVV